MARREKEIRIMVSSEEYEQIRFRAKGLGMQVAPYIRRVAQNPTIINYNYDEIRNHTKEIAEIRNSVNRLIFTIEATNNYLPREIVSIVNLMQEIFRSENCLLKQTIQNHEKLEKRLCDPTVGIKE